MTPEEVQQAALMRAMALRGQEPQMMQQDADALSGIGGAMAGWGGKTGKAVSDSSLQRGDALRVLAQGAMRQREAQALEGRREERRRKEHLSDVASQRGWQDERDEANRRNQILEAEILAGRKQAENRAQATVPGFDISPDAAPTADDAKKLKTANESAKKLGGLVKELKALHGDKGTEMGGAAAERMRQLMTAIRLEAKNVADLGALSGPDLDLMIGLSGADPTSLGSNLKALVGADNTQSALDGLDAWANNALSSRAQASGYVPKAGEKSAAPAQATAPAGARPSRTVGGVTKFWNGQAWVGE